EIDDEQIEDAEQDQRDIAGEAVAIELVGDEQAEHGDARGIGPELLAQQADHQDRLNDPMAQEIESEEMLLSEREEMRDSILRVDFVDPARDGLGAEQIQREPAANLDQRMQPLQRDADDEDLVDASFLHRTPNAAPARLLTGRRNHGRLSGNRG